MRAIYAQTHRFGRLGLDPSPTSVKSTYLNRPRPAITNFHWSSQRFCPPPTDADAILINIIIWHEKRWRRRVRERSVEGVLKRERFVAVDVNGNKSLTLTANSRFLLKLTCFYFYFCNCCPDSSNCRRKSRHSMHMILFIMSKLQKTWWKGFWGSGVLRQE